MRVCMCVCTWKRVQACINLQRQCSQVKSIRQILTHEPPFILHSSSLIHLTLPHCSLQLALTSSPPVLPRYFVLRSNGVLSYFADKQQTVAKVRMGDGPRERVAWQGGGLQFVGVRVDGRQIGHDVLVSIARCAGTKCLISRVQQVKCFVSHLP